jgi:hypothetical protein
MPYSPGKTVSSIGGTFDGGGAVPAVSSLFFFVAQFSGIIDRWDIVADAVGSAVVDVWKAAGAIPTVANTIAGAEKPTLSAAQLASDTTLITSWGAGRTVSVGDVFGFNLDSVATVTRVTVELRVLQG